MVRRALLVTIVLLTVLVGGRATAGNRFAIELPHPERTRAFRYAAMGEASCLAELDRRAVPFERLGPTRGIATPIRLSGPLRGINFVPTYRPDLDPRASTTRLDCRLALALDDLALELARQGVAEVEYLSMYRPGQGRPGARHGSGRAIDVATVRLATGERYSVIADFHGRVGAQTCGFGAAPPQRDTAGAAFWRSVVCNLHELGSFNIVITPNYDRGHKDHLHLEVRSGIRWALTQ